MNTSFTPQKLQLLAAQPHLVGHRDMPPWRVIGWYPPSCQIAGRPLRLMAPTTILPSLRWSLPCDQGASIPFLGSGAFRVHSFPGHFHCAQSRGVLQMLPLPTCRSWSSKGGRPRTDISGGGFPDAGWAWHTCSPGRWRPGARCQPCSVSWGQSQHRE